MTGPSPQPTPITTDVASSQSGNSATPFFPVSTLKLLVLSICTFGFYEVYWFYKNWQLIKAREQSNISPAPRAVFSVLYCYQCFSRIRNFNSSALALPSFAAGPLAAGWIITTMLYKLPDPFWLVSLFAPVFLLPVQARVNKINSSVSPSHDLNDQFSSWNWVAIGIGSVVLVLGIIGTFMPPK